MNSLNNLHNSTIVQSKITMDSKTVDDESISKWQKVKISNC